jgi:hypothetical protein
LNAVDSFRAAVSFKPEATTLEMLAQVRPAQSVCIPPYELSSLSYSVTADLHTQACAQQHSCSIIFTGIA